MSQTDLLKGPERLEFVPELGRALRCGNSDLSLSDATIVARALQNSDADTALRYIEYLNELYIGMVKGAAEWAGHWREVFQREEYHIPHDLQTATFQKWQKAAALLDASPAAFGIASEYLNPDTKCERSPRNILASLESHFVELAGSVRDSRFADAQAKFLRYQTNVRDFHDLLICYLAAAPTELARVWGPAVAEKALGETFQRCSFNEPMWNLFRALAPEQRALFLAEHMRAHLSGGNRDGQVTIEEEPEQFRITFDVCGSGGALRRSLAAELVAAPLHHSSPATWGREGQVPAYCAHCALNEITSVKKFGQLLWRTEFNQDPQAKCSWLVTKSPKLSGVRDR